MGHPPFAPFGEMYAQSGVPAWSFTGEEGTADTVSDEYDFLARKLHSSQGRWISPDPAGLNAADLTNPQSWNLYAYVTNDPLSSIDPLGLVKLCPPGSGPGTVNSDGTTNCGTGGGWWDLALEGGASWDQVCFSLGICQKAEPLPQPPKLKRNVTDCRYVDPFSAGFLGATKFKFGPGGELGPLSAGLSITKTYGDSGLGSEAVIGFKGVLSIQRTSDTTNLGGPICCTNSITILGFNKDLSSGEWKFQPSKEFKFGLQALFGLEFGWDSDKYTQAVNQNRACGYYDHK